MKYLLISTAIIICFAFTCAKTPDCGYEYSLEFPLTITDQDTFQVGDTIWYEMDLDTLILDHNSGEYINWKDFELYFELCIGRMDTNFITYVPSFDYYEDQGSVSFEPRGLYIYTETIQDKHFRIGVIPQQTGAFIASLSLPLDYLDVEINALEEMLEITNRNCVEYFYDYSTVVTDSTNGNWEIIEDNYPCSYGQDSLTFCIKPSLMAKGSFAFYVKD